MPKTIEDSPEMKRRIEEDPDFICSRKYSNSLARAVESNPDGMSFREIAMVMMATEDEIRKTYDDAVKKIQGIVLPSE